jgi:F-type H+-transporting ATPase subunit gamma
MQITSAMKMVSAAKLKRAQDAIVQMRPYANKLKEMLENVSASVDASGNVYARSSKIRNVLIIAVSSNRGLAGAFNSNVIRKVNLLIREDYAGADVTVMPVGKKVQDAFKRSKYAITGQDLPHHNNHVFDKLAFENVTPVVEKVMDAFVNQQFDRVILVYNQFRNAAVQIATAEQLLPLVPPHSDEKKSRVDYIFEPDQDYIVNELIPKAVKIQFYKALLDSFASEHGARMTAMHKATDNAKAMQRDLKIMYNKARQASITKEILEIVAGADALSG